MSGATFFPELVQLLTKDFSIPAGVTSGNFHIITFAAYDAAFGNNVLRITRDIGMITHPLE